MLGGDTSKHIVWTRDQHPEAGLYKQRSGAAAMEPWWSYSPWDSVTATTVREDTHASVLETNLVLDRIVDLGRAVLYPPFTRSD